MGGFRLVEPDARLRRAAGRAAALVGAGHDAGRDPLAGLRRGRCPAPVAWVVHRRSRWRCWSALPAWPTAAPGSASTTAGSAPAGPRIAAAHLGAVDAAGRRARPAGSPGRTPTPAPTCCCGPTSSARSGWRSPTRPTRRRTGWSCTRHPDDLAGALGARWPHGRGLTPAPLGTVRPWHAGRTRRSGPSSRWSPRSARPRCAQEGPRHDLEGRDRQEPAGEPRRPRRRHLGGRRSGPRSAARWSALARMLAQRRAATYYATLDRPPAARAQRTATSLTAEPARTAREGPLTRATAVCRRLRRRAAFRRSRGRSASSRPPAGCGGGPGSSSCR